MISGLVLYIEVLLLTNSHEKGVVQYDPISAYFQGDPISAYFLIIALEVLFALIKNKIDMKGIVLYDHRSLFTAYTNNSTFFIEDISSVKMLFEIFKEFSCFFG